MVIGDGENGKSTFLALVRVFLGIENVSGPSLQDLINNRFASADLFGKLANIHADIPNKPLKVTGKFKMLTGGDLIYAEKKHRDAFKFVNTAKLLFSANEIPQTEDKTRAFYRRWVFIDFPWKFTDDPNDSNKNKDPYILEKITTPEELSGLLNWALEGLHRLLEHGGFSDERSPEEISEIYERMSDPIKAFIEDRLEVNPEKFAPKDAVYNAYSEYMRERGVPVKDKNVFSRMLPARVSIEEYRPQVKGKQVRCWKGIALKETQLQLPIQQGRSQDSQDNQYFKESIENINHIPNDVKNIPTSSTIEELDVFCEVCEQRYGVERPATRTVKGSKGLPIYLCERCFDEGDWGVRPR
jgi:putative DNA primase/helicase